MVPTPARPPRPRRHPPRGGEEGHLLIALVVAVSIMLIFSGIAVQAWSMTIKRDREEELIFRGKQIAMAILLYRKDHGAPPTDLKQLQERGGPGGGHYYLRRHFTDPMSEDGEWGLVYLSPEGGQFSSSSLEENRQLAEAGTIGGTGLPPSLPSGGFGLPIIGVHSSSDAVAIGPARWRNGQRYNEWLFTVDDVMTAAGAGAPVPVPGAPDTPTTGTPTISPTPQPPGGRRMPLGPPGGQPAPQGGGRRNPR